MSKAPRAAAAASFGASSGGASTAPSPDRNLHNLYQPSHPTDLLGSTRAVTDGVTGAVLESYDFEPWGLLMPGRTLGSGTKEGFTGKEQDLETGLDYFGARYYMPALARWTGVDPLAEKHPEWTPYNYVLNNPLVLIDPDGRQDRPNTWLDYETSSRVAVNPFQFWVDVVSRPPSQGDLALSALALVNPIAGVGGRMVTTAATFGDDALRVAAAQARIKANQAQGAVFEAQVVQDLQQTQAGVVQQVTIRTRTGVRTRTDVVGRDIESGAVRLTEAKSSNTARLTDNQKSAFPEIQKSGGTVAGKGKPGFPGGTKIPPTEVEIKRPDI